MNDVAAGLISRAAALRRAFNHSFAEPRHIDTAPTQDFLVVRLGAEPHAIRLADIAGLFADRTITRLPGQMAALRGIAGFRGAIVPVYDLGLLLGYPAAEAPRWLVMAAAVAFAFDAFDGHLRLTQNEIVPHQAGADSRRHVRGFAHSRNRVLPIVHLTSVLDAIRAQALKAAPGEERST